MAILGLEGRVQLVREYPDPEHHRPASLNARLDAIQSRSTAYWSGDRVVLFCERGLPTVRTPTGTAQWYGVGYNELGPTRAHITSGADPYWNDDDTVPPWELLAADDPVQGWYYINIDEFDRISFYDTQTDALSGTRGRLPIHRVDWGDLLMAAAPQEPYILNAAVNADGTYDDLPYDWAEIGAATAELEELFKREWSFLCNLRSWNFETNSAAIDTTPIGVRFGEAVKSVVTGTGSLDFLVRRQDQGWNGLKTMRLALLTEKGCKAKAQFVLTTNDRESCGDGMMIYYEADILVTACSLSVRADEALAATASFGTTGPIELRMAPALG